MAERARALLAGPPPRRRMLAVAVATLTLSTAVAALAAGDVVEDRLEVAHHAYLSQQRAERDAAATR